MVFTFFYFNFSQDFVIGTNYNISAGCECGGCSILNFGNPTGNYEFSSVFNITNSLKLKPIFENNKGSFCVNRVELYFCSLPSIHIALFFFLIF